MNSTQPFIFTVCMLFLAICHGLVHGDMRVDTQPDGSYEVVVNTEAWLRSGPTTFQANGMHHSTANKTLKMIGEPWTGSGRDRLGDWSTMTYPYGVHDGPEQLRAHVRTYKNVPAVVFSQVKHYLPVIFLCSILFLHHGKNIFKMR